MPQNQENSNQVEINNVLLTNNQQENTLLHEDPIFEQGFT